MTTPTTSAVRAWARKNGYEISDRGRLPVEVTSAYAEAHGTGAGDKATARKAVPAATARTTPARAATAKNGTTKAGPTARKAGTAKSSATKAGTATAGTTTGDAPTAADTPAAGSLAAAPDLPSPTPSPVTEDRRLVALGEELAALTERVIALEAALSNGGRGKAIRFLRRA